MQQLDYLNYPQVNIFCELKILHVRSNKCHNNIEGLFIELWSDSARYLAAMLTEGAQSWRVEDSRLNIQC